MIVVGGIYSEYCYDPHWHQIFGSGGRGAAALKTLGVSEVQLHSCFPINDRAINATLTSYGISLHNLKSSPTIEFRYTHPLSNPQWHKTSERPECFGELHGDCVVAYGMIEGYARLAGGTIVYDPQSEDAAIPIEQVIASADRLALVLNEREVTQLGGDADYKIAAQGLLESSDAEVIVVKRGPYGCTVVERENITTVPLYRSSKVFKIGTGDIFTAAFAFYWFERKISAQAAADAASRCVAAYAETQSIDSIATALPQNRLPVLGTQKPKIYLAGPFFSLSQRFLVEEAKRALGTLGGDVFSPLHEVGLEGSAQHIALNDLRGLDKCNAVLALLTDLDVGTIFEIGYATAKKIPVVAYSEGVKAEHLVMLMGTDCICSEDFCSAVYQSIWAAT